MPGEYLRLGQRPTNHLSFGKTIIRRRPTNWSDERIGFKIDAACQLQQRGIKTGSSFFVEQWVRIHSEQDNKSRLFNTILIFFFMLLKFTERLLLPLDIVNDFSLVLLYETVIA